MSFYSHALTKLAQSYRRKLAGYLVVKRLACLASIKLWREGSEEKGRREELTGEILKTLVNSTIN